MRTWRAEEEFGERSTETARERRADREEAVEVVRIEPLADFGASKERRATPRRKRFSLPDAVVEEARSSTWGTPKGFAERLAEAAESYERDRYPEALRLLSAIRHELRTPAVEELYGLTCYRVGRWEEAARRLKQVAAQTGSVEQHPVIMDCYRAMGKPLQVRRFYDELLVASPGADLVAEARIVLAESMAEEGDIGAAISLLRKAARKVANPRAYHVRQWYVLGDLYERSGDLSRAATYFRLVLDSGEDSYDAPDRIAAIS